MNRCPLATDSSLPIGSDGATKTSRRSHCRPVYRKSRICIKQLSQYENNIYSVTSDTKAQKLYKIRETIRYMNLSTTWALNEKPWTLGAGGHGVRSVLCCELPLNTRSGATVTISRYFVQLSDRDDRVHDESELDVPTVLVMLYRKILLIFSPLVQHASPPPRKHALSRVPTCSGTKS